jgi:hypothetical protein
VKPGTKYAYQWYDRNRAYAFLSYPSRAYKVDIYLSQKPLDIILGTLRRRGANDPELAKWVRAAKMGPGEVDERSPDFVAYSRILKALAIKVYIIANGRSIDSGVRVPLREHIQIVANVFEQQYGIVPKSGINIMEKILSNMVFDMDDEIQLRNCLKGSLTTLGEVLVCDEKLWFYSGEADGWVRLVISKPDRVGHWFYLAAVKLSNDKFYVAYYRLHRTVSKKADEPPSITVAGIGRDWLSLMAKSDSEVTHTFFVADGYYMSEAMRDLVVANKQSAIIACPPERWPKMASLIQPQLKNAGDSAALYNEGTDEVVILIKYESKLISRSIVAIFRPFFA